MIGAYKACKALGKGWRLPSFWDWKRLYDAYSASKNSDGFSSGGMFVEEESFGFNLRHGGYRDNKNKDRYFNLDEKALYWWTYDGEVGSVSIIVKPLETAGYRSSFRSNKIEEGHLNIAFSCRCLRD